MCFHRYSSTNNRGRESRLLSMHAATSATGCAYLVRAVFLLSVVQQSRYLVGNIDRFLQDADKIETLASLARSVSESADGVQGARAGGQERS